VNCLRFPVRTIRFYKALRDPNASIHQVAEIIGRDVGMSAKVLHLVNSAFFGLAQVVTSLQSAAAFLGMETIKNLAFASETFRVFAPDSRISAIRLRVDPETRTPLPPSSPVSSPWTRKLGTLRSYPLFLHDIGRLILPAKCRQVLRRTLACQRTGVRELRGGGGNCLSLPRGK